MNRYVTQLLEDIELSAAHAHLSRWPIKPDEDEEYDLEEAVFYARRVVLADRIGLPAYSFPPIDCLSEKQAELLASALEDCLHHFGYLPVFPRLVNAVQRYLLLRECLKEEVPVLHQQLWPLACCKHQPASCPLGSYCGQCHAEPPPDSEPDDLGGEWSQHPDYYHWKKAFPEPDYFTDSFNNPPDTDDDDDDVGDWWLRP